MKGLALVAHRGFAGEYPENSLSAFEAAVGCGCLYLELDIQVTQDNQAVVIHDTTLARTGMNAKNIFTTDWSDLRGENIGESLRFLDKFHAETLMSLSDFSHFLQKHPLVHTFVEIKEESIERLGAEAVLDIVCHDIASVKSQCTIISFDASVLFEAKKHRDYPLGYVMHKYDEAHYATAKALSPDVLICNYKKIPDEDGSLWEGSWEWFLYEIIDPSVAIKWHDRGVKYIETMQIEPMIKELN